MGYHMAGFEVVGVDVVEQCRYPFQFIRADVMAGGIDMSIYDAIHASPPCQGYSPTTDWRGNRGNHPRLIDDVRSMLEASGKVFVIENVAGARKVMRNPFMLCGSHFGLKVQRHRYFESPFIPFFMGEPCRHVGLIPFDHGGTKSEKEYRAAMKCDWMSIKESRQAIPPAYTEWIGRKLLDALGIQGEQNAD